MTRKERTEVRFRKRLKAERDSRGLSQAELVKLLKDKDTQMDAIMVSKIENGTRTVRLDEAAALADIFGLSLDGLLGRHGLEDEKGHAMTVLADEAGRMLPEVAGMAERLRDAYAELERQFDFRSFDQLVADGGTWSLDGLDIEHRRALLMWAGREMAQDALATLTAGLLQAASVRSMTARQLTAYLRKLNFTPSLGGVLRDFTEGEK